MKNWWSSHRQWQLQCALDLPPWQVDKQLETIKEEWQAFHQKDYIA
jgi:hypothetical protein